MASFNKVIIAGNLTRDPEVIYLASGKALCKFGIAINHRWTSESGERKEDVTFLDCKAFGKLAETIEKYLRKGSSILVEGRITQESWDDKTTGQKRTATRIVVENFTFLGSAKGAPSERGESEPSERGESEPRKSNPAPAPSDAPADDIPF